MIRIIFTKTLDEKFPAMLQNNPGMFLKFIFCLLKLQMFAGSL